MRGGAYSSIRVVWGDGEERLRFLEDVVFGEVEGVEMGEPSDARAERVAAQVKVHPPRSDHDPIKRLQGFRF